jgi:hypothetical protein
MHAQSGSLPHYVQRVQEFAQSNLGLRLLQEATAEATEPAVDKCVAAARHFHSLGIPACTLDLFVNKDGVKKPRNFTDGWKECRLDNCLQKHVKRGRNSLAIMTGSESDCYVVDIDLSGGGDVAFGQMVEENDSLPDDTPCEQTGRGGLHLFFSLAALTQAGLISGGNRQGLTWRKKKVGIDTRGDGGLIYCDPSSYRALDGEERRYEWIQEILKDRSNLRAMPDFLIAVINGEGAAAR